MFPPNHLEMVLKKSLKTRPTAIVHQSLSRENPLEPLHSGLLIHATGSYTCFTCAHTHNFCVFQLSCSIILILLFYLCFLTPLQITAPVDGVLYLFLTLVILANAKTDCISQANSLCCSLPRLCVFSLIPDVSDECLEKCTRFHTWKAFCECKNSCSSVKHWMFSVM